MLFKATERHGISENSQLFGPVAEKRNFPQITLFRTKCSKMGQKPIRTIKSTTFFFDYSTQNFALLAKNYHGSDHVPNFF